MSETAKTDDAEMRYLLGDLSEDERTRMERAFFADDSKFEAIRIAEDELIDAYVRNDLSPEEQRQFKTRLLSSQRIRDRVNFSRALAQKVNSVRSSESEAAIEPSPSFSSPRTESKTPWWKSIFLAQPAFGIAMAAGAVLILVASVILVTGWLRLKSESERLATERAALQRRKEALDKLSADQLTSTEQSRAELQRKADQLAEDRKHFEELQAQKGEPGTQSILGAVSSILLTSGSSRSGGNPHELVHRPGASRAELKLILQNNDYPSYAISVNTPGDDVIHRKESIRPRKSEQGPLLILSIPRQKLPPGDYVVVVKGRSASGQLEPVAGYQFRVLAAK